MGPDQIVRPGWRTRLGAGDLVAVVLLALGAALLFLPLSLADGQHLPTAQGDAALQVWFLAADHYALIHGHFSLLTTRIDYPAGVNMMDNTSMMALALIATPVFSLAGPVGAFVFLMRLAFLLSGVSCYFVLRSYVRSRFAAWAGAVVYAFGPFMAHQGQAHVFLTFVPIPPLLFWLVERHLFAGRRRPALGLLLGGLIVVQYFISAEVLIATGLLIAVAAVVAALAAGLTRRPVLQPVRAALPAIGVAVALAAVILAYPAWYALGGSQHISGPSQQAVAGIDTLNTFFPVTSQVVAWTFPGFTSKGFAQSGDLAFVGIPLLVIAAVVIWTQRRRRPVLLAAVVGAAAWILTLGPRLIVHGHTTSIRLPFRVLDHLPLLQDLVPARFALFDDLAAGALLAVGVDRVLARGSRRRAVALAAVVAILGVVFVLPTAGYPAPGTGPAGYFLDGRADRAVPPGSVVLTYPYPMATSAQPMIWQADAGLSWSMLGGYALRPYPDPAENKLPPLLAPTAVLDAWLQAWPARLPGSRPTSEQAAVSALPDFVRRYHVTVIVVEMAGRDPGAVVRICRAVYGPPTSLGDLRIWSHLAG